VSLSLCLPPLPPRLIPSDGSWDLMSPLLPLLLQLFLRYYRTFFPSAPPSPRRMGTPAPTDKTTDSPLRSFSDPARPLEVLFSLQPVLSSKSSTSLRKEYSLISHETLLNFSENMHGTVTPLSWPASFSLSLSLTLTLTLTCHFPDHLPFFPSLKGGAIALAMQEAVWSYCKEFDLPIRRIR
jgi:hypothetical protein